MFPGQGSQYAHMARELYEQERVFKNILDQCISLAHEHSDIALHEVMYPEGSSSRYDIDETRWTQISLFSIEYSLSKYLEHLGVRADAFIGHSIGEYVAATLCGVFSLEDAIKAVIARGKLMQGMKPGCMLAISAAASSIKAKALEHNCEISVINSPEDVVCSGNEKDIKKLQEAFDEQGIATVILNTSHAYHSRLMDKAAQG
jgi:acyl transferase domain-containing protein